LKKTGCAITIFTVVCGVLGYRYYMDQEQEEDDDDEIETQEKK